MREEDQTRMDALNMVFKMYDLHYRTAYKEGARRPFRIEWAGTSSSTDENTFQFGYDTFAITNYYTGRPHYFETAQLMDKFVHKCLRARGLQDV